jgi:HAD superfamily hydrolase (TIGR01509 family)
MAPPPAPELVIFDCDGVLMDSEIVACRIDSACLAEIGIDLPVEALLQRYLGIGLTDMLADIAANSGHSLPADFADTLRRRTRQAFETDLVAIEGVVDVLASLNLPVCVASGSEPARLAHSLGLVGLWERFAPHVFSAIQVARGKPAPDLFLFAADRLQVEPAACVVIEDSPAGICAARAAGMRPLGFTGASHGTAALAAQLREAGAAAVFTDMQELPALLAAR